MFPLRTYGGGEIRPYLRRCTEKYRACRCSDRIIREDLITEEVLPGTPTMLTYKTHADAESLYNTPNCYGIYMCGKVFQWLKRQGGLEAMKKHNEKKAKILYDFLDASTMFKGTVEPDSRSLMNVPFVQVIKIWTRNLSKKPQPQAS